MTLKAKYIKPHRLRARLAYIANLAGAVAASPYLLSRRDGLRETLFVLAACWARVLGPLPPRDSRPAQRRTARSRRQHARITRIGL